jgi:hypothetical protein
MLWFLCVVLSCIILVLLVNIAILSNSGIKYYKDIERFNYKINHEIKPQIYNDGYENAICTLYTPNIKDYAIHSIKNMKKYCVEHGLTLYIFNEAISKDVEHNCWNKIPAILYLMNHTKHKYIIWMDCDAVFNRFDITFNKYIDNHKDKDIIVCRDIIYSKYKFNSGIMIIKNNTWSKKIMEDTWNKDVKHGYNNFGDQVILKNTILEDGRKDNNYDENSGNKHISLLPEREFNSYPRNDTNKGKLKDNKPTKDDFIIHFMGYKTPERIKNISDINAKFNIN